MVAARRRPTQEELLAAVVKTVPDVIADDLKLLFVGINPGLYTAWAGHHFARPGNRFWRALYQSGFTDRLLQPEEEQDLLGHGCGITNLVQRATTSAAEITREELLLGGEQLVRKVKLYRPQWVAVLGVEAYRSAFSCAGAQVGLQPGSIDATRMWVLPNPSGLNAHYTPQDMASLFSELRSAVEGIPKTQRRA